MKKYLKHGLQPEKLLAHRRIVIAILLSLLIVWLITNLYNHDLETKSIQSQTEFGVSFSPYYAQELGLNPKETYQSIITDLSIKKIRLAAYWSKIEPKPQEYDFNDLDYYIDQAHKHQVSVILAIGYKAPRWPECYQPDWLQSQPEAAQKIERLKMLATVVQRYNDNPAISAWQVENEPFFAFGHCKTLSKDLLAEEVELVRSLSHKPIIITDSGEYGSWIVPMQLSDILGTTLYRSAYFAPIGHLNYPLKPWFYRLKSFVIRSMFAPHNKKIIVTELQAEPWPNKPLKSTPIDEQIKLFPLENLNENIIYARRSGFNEIYLWGVEWWYYLQKHGHDEYLKVIKTL